MTEKHLALCASAEWADAVERSSTSHRDLEVTVSLVDLVFLHGARAA